MNECAAEVYTPDPSAPTHPYNKYMHRTKHSALAYSHGRTACEDDSMKKAILATLLRRSHIALVRKFNRMPNANSSINIRGSLRAMWQSMH